MSMLGHIKCFTILVLLLWSATVSSQRFDFRLNHIDLPISGLIEAFEEDSLGYLWIGSTNGLYRYNGTDVVQYNHDPKNENTIGQNYVSDVARDRTGALWVSTFGTGLAKYNEDVNLFTRLPLSRAQNANTRACKSIMSSPDNKLWTSSYYGLNKIDPGDFSYQHFVYQDGDPAQNFLNEIVLIEERYLLLFPRDLPPYVFNLSTESYMSLDKWNHYLADHLSSDSKLYWHESTNRTWIANCTEIALFQDSTMLMSWDLGKIPFKDKGSCISQLIVGKNEIDIWVIIDGELYLFNKKNVYEQTEILQLPERQPENVLMLYEDAHATIWIAADNGLFKLERNATPFRNIQIPGLSDQQVSGITAISDDELAISGWEGFYNYNVEREIFSRFLMPKSTSDEIRAFDALHFLLREDSTLWAPMRNYGLLEFTRLDNGQNWQLSEHINSDNSGLSSDEVMLLEEDMMGSLWVGNFRTGVDILTKEGTWHYLTNDPTDSTSLSSNIVSNILRDKKDRMWVSTYGGGVNLYIPDPSDYYSGHFERILSTNSDLSHNVVPYIHEDSDGHIWIATYSGGLNRYDPTSRQFEIYTMEDGLPSNLIYTITSDLKNHLWLATDRGLVEFDPVLKSIRTYDTRDGLVTSELAYNANLSLSNGCIALGTDDDGMILFHPDSLQRNSLNVHLIHSNILLDNRTLKVDEEGVLSKSALHTNSLELNHAQSNIGFQYEVIDTKGPGSYQYAYRLSGFDQDWKIAGSNNIMNYTNLDPGKYTWEVKAGRKSGDWNLFTHPIYIQITPPWWRTWWAYMLYISILSVAIIMIYRYQQNKWRLQMQLAVKDEQLALSEKQREAEKLKTMLHTVENERQRIAKDLHDSMGSILSRIKSNYQFTATHLPESRQNMISETNEMIDTASDEIRRISHNMMPTALMRLGLQAALKDLVVPLRRAGITASLEIIDVPEDVDEGLALTIYRIIQELLNNVLKHSSAKNVWIQMSYLDQQIQIFVEDDGKGFDVANADISNGIGLDTVKSRIDYLNGAFDILSVPGDGSTFTIHIPWER